MKRLILLAAAWMCAPGAMAQAYPSKPVRMITLFAPGSTGDTTGRVITAALAEAMGQSVLLENVQGGGGVLAAERVARAAPDGYSILYSLSSVHVMRPFLSRNTPFHPLNDFTPITQIGEAVTMLVAHPSLPANSFRELLDYARANPGKVSYGTSGIGSPTHLAGELIRQLTGVEMVHVPYKAVAQAMNDVMGGQIPTSYAIAGLALSAARSGKIKVLAIVGDERYSRMPDVPTMQEVIPKFETPPSWTGFFGPAKLPPAILNRLHSDIVKVLSSPDIKSKLADRDFHVVTQKSPEAFAEKIRREVALVGGIVKRAGIRPAD